MFGGDWLYAFQCAFNATPPEDNTRFERRARTEQFQFFPSMSAFDVLLRKLGLLRSAVPATEKLTTVLQASGFDVFMSEQLGLSDIVREYFLKQYSFPEA